MSSPENGRPQAQLFTDDDGDDFDIRSPAKTPEYHLITSSDEEGQTTSAHNSKVRDADAMEVDNDANVCSNK